MNNYLCSGYIYEACSIINFNEKAIALKTKDFCICDVYYDEYCNKHCYILTGAYKGKTLKELKLLLAFFVLECFNFFNLLSWKKQILGGTKNSCPGKNKILKIPIYWL